MGLLTEDGAPWCYAADASVLRCSTLADRTVRSGIYELEEWKRLDRPYCSNSMFRALVLDNVSMTEAECRLAINERHHNCQFETCPQCTSPCNYPWAKAIADVFKCFRTQTHYGFVHYYMVSDAGACTPLHPLARTRGRY